MNGTSKNKCCCKSWLQHWEKNTQLSPEQCCVLGCINPAKVGAHVQIKYPKIYGNEWFIVPMCMKHNHYSNSEIMALKKGTLLVSARTDKCGKLKPQ